MKSINVLIVEDELLIAETIKLYLLERGHAVVGIAISYEEAIEALKESKPDIVLLDVRLYGEKSGIDIANYLQNSRQNIPYVILSSQFDAKTIQSAMLSGAAGYITKPISKETLWSTIELTANKKYNKEESNDFVDLKVGAEIQRIKLNEVLFIKSDHVYLEVVCTTQKYICRYTLGELLTMLDETTFVRCHRSYIVNITKIEKYASSKIWIEGNIIPISAKYKESIFQRIQNMRNLALK